MSGLSLFFVATVWIPATLMSIVLLTGVSSPWVPVTVGTIILLALLWYFVFRNLSRKESLCLAGAVTVLILIAATCSICFYDSTGDGRWYHADAILALLKGINPVYTQIPADVPVWSNHYPKASWYFSAAIIHAAGKYQLGKIYNFLLILGCAAYGLGFFRRLGVSGIFRVLLTCATAFAPVAVSQMLTYYVDGALGSLLSILVMTTVSLLYFPTRMDRLLFAVVASLAIGLKFTAIPYVGVIALVLIGVRLLSGRQKKQSLRTPLLADSTAIVLAFCIGILVVGYSPYVTNVKDGQHPLYPVMGPNKIDIMTAQTPLVLRDRSYNRFQKFFVSFFSHSQEFVQDRKMWNVSFAQSGLKIPFSVNAAELISQGGPDIRLAGWGVFFSGVTLFGLIVFVLSKGWSGREGAPILVALSLIVVTSFINPECWNARYTPQIALLPVFLLIPGLRATSTALRNVARGLCAILLLNSLLMAGGATALAFLKTRRLNQSFATIARTAGTGEYWAYRKGTMHLIQFSGLKGITICGEVRDVPDRPLPEGGIPVGMSISGPPEMLLYHGSCAAGQPF